MALPEAESPTQTSLPQKPFSFICLTQESKSSSASSIDSNAASRPPAMMPMTVSADTVIGIIAGGRDAAFESIEDAEDDFDSCVKQMKEKGFCGKDVCVGLSASGSANCCLLYTSRCV